LKQRKYPLPRIENGTKKFEDVLFDAVKMDQKVEEKEKEPGPV